MPAAHPDVSRTLEVMYSDHHSWLYRWLCKKLQCPHHAADMAQDTFYRLFSFIGLRDVREPRALLVTTASRLMIDDARRRKIEQKYQETYQAYYGDQMVTPSPEEVAMVTDTLVSIAAMLEGLAEKPRNAFLMNRLDGMCHGEIAEQLGVSKSSVKKYIAAAMFHCHRLILAEEGAQ